MTDTNHKSKMPSIAACLIVMFSIGIVYLWSVFQKPVIDYYGWEPASVSMISSVMILMFIFGTMVGGFILDRKSPRFVVLIGGALFFTGLFTTSLLGPQYPWMTYITYGAFAGCGVGFAYSGSVNCIQKWFPHRRGFATGLSVCAFGLSVVVFAPVIEWLLKLPSFGTNAVPLTFRTLAFLFTAIIAAAGMFMKNPGDEYIKKLNLPGSITNQKQYKPGEMAKTAPYWLLSAVIFFLPAAYMIIIPLVKTLAASRGIPEYQASITVSLMGVASAASRLVSGIVSDRLGRAKTVFILALIMLTASLLIIFAGGWFYTVVVLMIAFAYGGPSSIYPAMVTDLYGTKNSGANYGIALIFMGISSPVFTVVSNSLNADGFVTGDYTLSFIFAACVCVIPLVALPLFDVFKKKLQNN